MGTYVSVALRQQVIERAGNRCEYCGFPQSVTLLAFEMEHIISEKHGGTTSLENLALACPYCNRAKGTDLAQIIHDCENVQVVIPVETGIHTKQLTLA